jgi:predicted dehydrogenase
MNPMHNEPEQVLTTRRGFLKQTSAAVVSGPLVAGSVLTRQARAASSGVLKVGLVGCGGRGTGAASDALNGDKQAVVTAMGDAFEDSLKRSLATLERTHGDRIKVEPRQRFVGLDAFQRVIDSGVDVVILATPPGFRPAHLKAAVEAGKHVFCEKPVATDAPGVRSVLASAKLAQDKGLAIVSGFCWRYDYARRAFYQRIHQGAIGPIRAIYATYYTGPVKPMPPLSTRPAEWTELQWQIRNWYNFVWLSGDGLVEQAVHSVDKIAWAMNDTPPRKAVAVGGRQIPNPGGNIFDHFEVNYEYPDGARAFLACRQQTGCYNQNADYVIGAQGTGLIGARGSRVEITGPTPWVYNEPENNMYQTEHEELFASIRAGRPLNNGVWMAHSTLLAIMGRMAAYTGQEIAWEQAMESQERLVPEKLSWDMPLTAPPVAMPGRTKFV